MKRRANLLLKVAIVLIGILLVVSVFKPASGSRQTTERFTSLFTDADKKRLACKNNACPSQEQACLEKCYNSIKDTLVCPGSVTNVDHTDENGMKLSVVNGIQCVHA